MRILQLIQKKQLRGAEVFACQLSNELTRLGHEVKMIALLDGEAVMPFRGEISVIGIDLSRRLIDYRGWKKLAEAIDHFQPDIVQANAGDTLKYAAMSRRIFGWKSKLVFRNANKMGDFIDSRWKWWYNKWLLQPVDFIASVSKECHDDFVKTFQWPGSAIKTLPIGVDDFEAIIANPLAEMQWQQKFPILLSVASFVKEKNHAGLINVFEQVIKRFPDAVLIMIGEGGLRSTIVQRCEEGQLSSRVWFAGRRSDVAAFMQRADALLLPSLIEGLPGVILEAFVNRLPVIAYNVGGIPEVIKNLETGVLIDKNNEPAFTEALCELLEKDKSWKRKLTDNAASLVRENYLNTVIAENFAHAYKGLMH